MSLSPLRYGKVDVMIVKNKVNGAIALIYPSLDKIHNTRTVCPLNTKQGYPHKQMTHYSFTKYFSASKVDILQYDEAIEWLKKYCSHFKSEISHYRLVTSFGRTLTNFNEVDGVLYETN